VVLDPAVLRWRVDAKGDELADRPGRQAVAADLLAGEDRLLQEQDVQPSRTSSPAIARYAAVADPLGPAPTMMTSALSPWRPPGDATGDGRAEAALRVPAVPSVMVAMML